MQLPGIKKRKKREEIYIMCVCDKISTVKKILFLKVVFVSAKY